MQIVFNIVAFVIGALFGSYIVSSASKRKQRILEEQLRDSQITAYIHGDTILNEPE